jgi:hypothetical protein
MHRPLGTMEYTYWMMGLASSTSFVVTCRLTGVLPHDVLSGALCAIQKVYPLLNVHIVPDKRYGAVFETCPDTSISLSIEYLPDYRQPASGSAAFDTPFIRRIETEQRFDFGAACSPLMRCLLLRHDADNDATLVLTFHHAIADALSAVAVLQNILTSAAAITCGRHPETVLLPDPGPLERYIPRRHCGTAAIGAFALHSLRQAGSRLSPSTRHLPVDEKAWPDRRRERFIMSVLDEHQTEALISTSRKKKCSVHAVLCATQLMALKEEYPLKPQLYTWLLSLVDCRRRFSPPVSPAPLGLMISMIESLVPVAETSTIEDLAAAIAS